MLIDMSLSGFLDETASSSPAPGGGSVSALAASLSAALTAMVCQLTIGKKKYADVEERMKDVLRESDSLRLSMQNVIDEDTRAFQGVMKAFGLPKESDEEKAVRSEAIQTATKAATTVPMELVRSCARFVGLVESVAAQGNKNSQSDAGVAALLLSAAVRGAAMNVYINLGSIKDADFAAAARKECEEAERNVMERCETVAQSVRAALLA